MQKKLHRQNELSRLERLYEAKEEIACNRLADISPFQDDLLSRRYIVCFI